MRTPSCHTHIWSKKNVQSGKTTLYYGPKKTIGCPHFPIFRNKSLLSCQYFVKKRPFFKKHTDVMPIFCRKTSILSKHSALLPFSSIFSWKNPCCHARIWLKKCHVCHSYTILWAKKVNRISFYRSFHEKKKSYAHIW